MRELRKIGILIDIDFPPSFGGTDTCNWTTITYRIKAHRNVARFKGDEIGEDAEELEAVDIKKYHSTQRFFPGNQMIWEKGEALRGEEE